MGLRVLTLAAALVVTYAHAWRSSTVASSCYETHGPGLHDVELESGRHFLLALPKDLPLGKRVPSVLDWHGYSESPFYQNQLIGFEETLSEYGWIGALPFGTSLFPSPNCCPFAQSIEKCHAGASLDKLNACSFNAGSCCGTAAINGTDD